MSKSFKPWSTCWTEADNDAKALVPPPALEDSPRETRHKIKRALASGGRSVLLEHFTKELRRVLEDQAAVLALIGSNPSWALPLLNRQFHAIRSAAEVLGLDNLAKVASRAEVLANLLDTAILPMTQTHGHILVQTHGLLVELVAHIAKHRSDEGCYPIAKTALWMYKLLDPALAEYEPGPSNARARFE